MSAFRFVPSRRRWLLAVAALALPIHAAWGSRVWPNRWPSPGPYAVRVVEDEWRDAASGRTVPVKLYVPDESAGRNLPAVLFSHGLGGSRDGGAMWGRHWASHGFVSIHLQHPGSDESLWRDRIAAGDRAGVRDAMKGGISARSALRRVADVKFALDEISRRAEAGDAVAARIDRSRIGMSGHSFGAWTTLAVSGAGFAMGAANFREPRLRAAIAFSPSAPPPAASWPGRFGAITVPFLSITGTRDGDVLERGTTPENRTQPFRFMPPPDKYLLVLDGADHMVFNGGEGGVRRPRIPPRPATSTSRRWRSGRPICRTTRAAKSLSSRRRHARGARRCRHLGGEVTRLLRAQRLRPHLRQPARLQVLAARRASP